MSTLCDEPKKWTRNEPNGVHFLKVREHILQFMRKQRGTQVTVSKVRIHLRKKSGLELTFKEIDDFMLNLGARHVDGVSSLVNPYIYDISDCR